MMKKIVFYLPKVVTLLALAMSGYHIYAAARGTPEPLIHRGIHLAFTLTLIFLFYPFKKARPLREVIDEAAPVPVEEIRPGLIDLLALVLSLFSIGYLFVNYSYVTERYAYVDPLRALDYVFGITLLVLVLEGARRTVGPALPLTALTFLVYAVIGNHLPGLLRHSGFSLEMIIDQLYLTTEGIFGIPLAVSASYVILFVIFGAFLEKSGTGQLFMDVASALTGSSRGGPGKISCISSGLFGTISGSAVANVMVDGWFTIPLMKRTGFKPHFAAAIEATASTGGQIMPPVMGAAAFVMAEFTGIPYIIIAKHALIPALLYYLALFWTIHYEAVKTNLRGLSKEELPNLKKVLRARGHLFLPIILLIYLMISGYTAPYAALWATVAVVLVSWIRKETRFGLRDIGLALKEGAKNTLSVAIACACAGIVIGVISLTGLGLRFTSLVITLASDSLIPALVLTMLAGIILGMGMPTTPAYIVQAALLIPALIKLGVLPIAAHLFVFYFAILSAITPPVAMAVYAAAGISGSNLWKTGIAAMKAGATGFIVPYMFVFGPTLLMIGSWKEILTALMTAMLGVFCLATGLQGWFLKKTTFWERSFLIAAALLLIKPGIKTDLTGLILLGVVYGLQRLRPEGAETRRPKDTGNP
ncbi:MAG TPA: TRAP transporter permease [Candidatus Limnocylindrales bacterium]|nr:TRAP transporter permease [Candidatus Limnocylindrales bacterium]